MSSSSRINILPWDQRLMLQTIRKNVLLELSIMVRITQASTSLSPFREIIQEWDRLLDQLEWLRDNSLIDPEVKIVLSEDAQPERLSNKVLRIGIYPISANPLHWGHLLVGLSAMTNYRLDKIIFIIAGSDPKKPHLAPLDWRHRASQEILQKFSPIFEYSDLAKGKNLDGEMNIFRTLALNPFQKIDAFYIVGTDHYYRHNPKKGDKDTIEKLEENIKVKLFGYNALYHSISVIFVDREGGSRAPVKTSLNVGLIPALPFSSSSTMVRDALATGDLKSLCLLPYTIYRNILSENIYQPAYR